MSTSLSEILTKPYVSVDVAARFLSPMPLTDSDAPIELPSLTAVLRRSSKIRKSPKRINL